MESDYKMNRREFVGKTAKILGLAYVSPSLLFPQEYSEREINNFLKSICDEIKKSTDKSINPSKGFYMTDLDGNKVNGQERLLYSYHVFEDGSARLEMDLTFSKITGDRSNQLSVPDMDSKRMISIYLKDTKKEEISIDDMVIEKNEFGKKENACLPNILNVIEGIKKQSLAH